MTTGARGVNAPDMKPIDAARLLIAFLADPVPGTASADLVKRYGSLPIYGLPNDGALSFEALRAARPETFESGLAMLLEVYAFDHDTEAFRQASTRYRDRPSLPPECGVALTVDPQPQASITIHARHDRGAEYVFAGPFLSAQIALDTDPRLAPGVLRSAELKAGSITFLAEGFRA